MNVIISFFTWRNNLAIQLCKKMCYDCKMINCPSLPRHSSIACNVSRGIGKAFFEGLCINNRKKVETSVKRSYTSNTVNPTL